MDFPLNRPAAQPALWRDEPRRCSLRPTAFCSSRGWTGRRRKLRTSWWTRRMAAERNGLWGRAYFDARGLKPGPTLIIWATNGFWPARNLPAQLGFETTVDDQPETFPAQFPDEPDRAFTAAGMTGNACGPFAQPKVEFMPGAFAYHLHSFSAATLRSTTQNWCGPLLAKGATCTMGCVYEPYLPVHAECRAFLPGVLATVYTFGEAAWTSQPALSWQTTVIGDPLYQPFGKIAAAVARRNFCARHNPLMEWSLPAPRESRSRPRRALAELLATSLKISTRRPTAPCSPKNSPTFMKPQGKPSSAIFTWQRALKLNPSPEQRIRLRLTLGEELQAPGRDAEAVEDCDNSSPKRRIIRAADVHREYNEVALRSENQRRHLN